MPARAAIEDPIRRLESAFAAYRDATDARIAQAEARLAALERPAPEPEPALTAAELTAFTRIGGIVDLDDWFEASDLGDNDAEAQHAGKLLGRVERLGPVLGLRVESRVLHGRRLWVLRRAGVDLGGAGVVHPRSDDPGA